jgi:hypothetical protein
MHFVIAGLYRQNQSGERPVLARHAWRRFLTEPKAGVTF